jgi:hypothetical protein
MIVGITGVKKKFCLSNLNLQQLILYQPFRIHHQVQLLRRLTLHHHSKLQRKQQTMDWVEAPMGRAAAYVLNLIAH